MPFYAIKTRTWKSWKVKIFPKGLVHGFAPKLAILPSFFLGNLGQENLFYDILERKKAFLCYNNKVLRKTKKLRFFQGGYSMDLVQIGHFSIFFFLGNLSQEKVFYNILERKNAFLCYKNKELKKSRNWDFSHGVSTWGS